MFPPKKGLRQSAIWPNHHLPTKTPCNSGFLKWHGPLGKKSFISTHERTGSSEIAFTEDQALASLLNTCNTRITAIKHCQHHPTLAQTTATSPTSPNTPTMGLSWNRKDKQELELHWCSLSIKTHTSEIKESKTSTKDCRGALFTWGLQNWIHSDH